MLLFTYVINAPVLVNLASAVLIMSQQLNSVAHILTMCFCVCVCGGGGSGVLLSELHPSNSGIK